MLQIQITSKIEFTVISNILTTGIIIMGVKK